MGERSRELRRRRHRKQKYEVLKRKLRSANATERGAIATKLRNMSPGAETLIERWGLAESNR